MTTLSELRTQLDAAVDRLAAVTSRLAALIDEGRKLGEEAVLLRGYAANGGRIGALHVRIREEEWAATVDPARLVRDRHGTPYAIARMTPARVYLRTPKRGGGEEEARVMHDGSCQRGSGSVALDDEGCAKVAAFVARRGK